MGLISRVSSRTYSFIDTKMSELFDITESYTSGEIKYNQFLTNLEKHLLPQFDIQNLKTSVYDRAIADFFESLLVFGYDNALSKSSVENLFVICKSGCKYRGQFARCNKIRNFDYS